MKDTILNGLISLMPESIKFRITKPIRQKLSTIDNYYSQNGEDILLQRMIGDKKNGFYVDVGAHHPQKFSNTHKLYLKGWHGINIDAMPGSMKVFMEMRPNDLNLEVGVSETANELTFHIFNKPALNTFSIEEAKKKDGKNGFFITNRVKVKTLPLREILDNNLPENIAIDYLNIDAEGFDKAVLKSNNWQKYVPRIITIEKSDTTTTVVNDDIYKFLINKGYRLVSVLFNTLFFMHRDMESKGVII